MVEIFCGAVVVVLTVRRIMQTLEKLAAIGVHEVPDRSESNPGKLSARTVRFPKSLSFSLCWLFLRFFGQTDPHANKSR